MQIPKDQIISLIESRLGGDQAQQASQQLPDQVDHEQHADLLKQFNIDPHELVQKFSGGLGKL
jgi:predicted PhzF superfamily epimerase YddE/YHI9